MEMKRPDGTTFSAPAGILTDGLFFIDKEDGLMLMISVEGSPLYFKCPPQVAVKLVQSGAAILSAGAPEPERTTH